MDEQTLKQHLGCKIRQYRKKNNLTQEGLGEIIERDQRQISLIENGVCFPSPEVLIKMTDVFKCEIMDLFNFETIEDIDIVKFKMRDMITNMSDEKLKIMYLIMKHL